MPKLLGVADVAEGDLLERVLVGVLGDLLFHLVGPSRDESSDGVLCVEDSFVDVLEEKIFLF